MTSTKKRNPVSLVTILVVVVCVLVLSSQFLRTKMPSDEQLIANFAEHRDSFTKLQQLLRTNDDLDYITLVKLHRDSGLGWITDPKPPEEVQAAFSKTGILFGAFDMTLDIRFMSFGTFSKELPGGDFSERLFEEKGYAYILESDEKVEKLLSTGKTYGRTKFRQIEGRWYIYEQISSLKPE